MFEQLLRLFEERDESLLEAELRRLLDDVDPDADHVSEATGSRGRPLTAESRSEAEPAEAAEAGAEPDSPLEGNAERLDRLVTAGRAHLDLARGAARQQACAAAEQARALAAFARTRPSSLDRSDAEIGAAAAQTRAGRHSALATVSEWAVDEVMVALGLTTDAATTLLVDSLLLVDRLPGTLQALSSGRISWAHAQVMTDLVAPLPADVRATAEERLLAKVEGRTRTQLRAAARRMVQKLDAAGVARRVTEAIRERRVTVHAGDDGMATLSATLPAPVARAVQDALGRYADAAASTGDERTRQQRMVDCLVDLVLRPGEHGLAPVQAQITLVVAVQTLLGGDEPGEVDGDLVPAEMVRELAVALGLMPRAESPGTEREAEPAGPMASGQPPADDSADQERIAGDRTGDESTDAESTDAESTDAESTDAESTDAESTDAEPTDAEPTDAESTDAESTDAEPTDAEPTDAEPTDAEPTDAEPTDAEPTDAEPTDAEPTDAGGDTGPRDDGRRAALADLLTTRTVRDTALAHRPQVALVDELSGQLVALTDAFAVRAGRALGPPPESPGYSPGAELDRFVRLRDRRCRFPGCRARPIRCDLDHTVPWPQGPTSHDNLCSLCRHHHRLSHQAPGWAMRGLADGGLEWTTPSGQVVTTHPTRCGADDWLDHPPPVVARADDVPVPDVPPGEPRPGSSAPDGRLDDPPPF
ncbi:DUF222 domain-containing protein [Modestobacter roseus]|uniref:DUF222 domain-containing protein n=1 Tax=Modestobacter roseus TaxID=1181884 RepID=UPI0034DE39BF